MTRWLALKWIRAAGSALCLLAFPSWAAPLTDCSNLDPRSAALQAVGSAAREYADCAMRGEPDACRPELERLTAAQTALQNSATSSRPECPGQGEPEALPEDEPAAD